MSENKESKNGYGVLIGAVSTVIILWSLNWILLWKFGGDNAEKGQFGDMFGSVNALFSGLAFAFLIYTIWLQREELSLQREELKLQREALELQAEELKRQADELAKTAELQAKTFNLQSKQLELTRKQIEDEKIRIENQNKPIFSVMEGFGGSWGDGNIAHPRLNIKNIGATALNVKISESPCLLESNKVILLVPHNGEISLQWEIKDIRKFPSENKIELTFNDSLGKEHIQSFTMKTNKNTGYNPPIDFRISE